MLHDHTFPTLLAAFAAAMLLAIAPTSVLAQDSGPTVTAGAEVYGNVCGRCHNPRSPLEHNDRAWVTIANHMRTRGNLTGAEVRAVLAFLQATNTDPREITTLAIPSPEAAAAAVTAGPPRTDSATIARGKALTSEKACVGCHVIASAGGNIGPALNGVVGRRGAEFVRQKLANPAFNTATSLMPNLGLTEGEIEAIVAYLASLNGRTP